MTTMKDMIMTTMNIAMMKKSIYATKRKQFMILIMEIPVVTRTF